ncbi:Coiled-coil domain-containing protein 81 [Globomyces sp. JEL0801]|nr:Coiled-coil domain-containing protein 81 [Globomyces sp. JEL0801]
MTKQSELCDLWKGVCKYLTDQLLMKKSINIHGVGAFFTKKTRRVTGDEGTVWSVHFSPSKNWDKLPGYQIDRSITLGTLAAEPLNLAAVAKQIGFTRDLVEAGVKDIVNALVRILRRGSIITLTMGVLGKLVFQNQDVKFRFAPVFLKQLNEDPRVIKRSTKTTMETVTETALKEKDEKNVTFDKNSKEQKTTNSDKKPQSMDHVTDKVEKPQTAYHKEEKESDLRELYNALDDDTNDDTRNAMVDLELASSKLANLEELIDQTFSIEARNGKESEEIKSKDSILTAQYNHMVALQEKVKVLEKKPMGDLFEKRVITVPVMSAVKMAKGIADQINNKKERLAKSARQHAIQDKLISERLRKEIKAAELQAHWDKMQRCQKQRSSLSEQIRINQEMKEKKDTGVSDNPFARSESLMALYQREKAKQLYYEQLAIVRQRRDYAQKVADIEKKHALTRLEFSRKELEKDLQMIKKGKIDMRNSLETYWSDQIAWKNRMKRDFDVEAS